MVSCLPCNCPVVSLRASDPFLFPKPSRSILSSRSPPSPRSRFTARPINAVGPQEKQQKQQQEVRTLFPGGFKRPEISIPTLVLRLSVDDVVAREAEIDVALLKGVGVVVLQAADETGARLYEAACALKSLVGDRAYLLIAERVDVAAAVGASGVVLSDAAIPTLVARNMMMRSKSDSVYLPLVARTVQNRASALSATSSEGADFLIMNMEDTDTALQEDSIFQHVKVPIFFIKNDFLPDDLPSSIASKLLKSGASGMVVSLNELRSFDGDTLNMFSTAYMANGAVRDIYQNLKTKTNDTKSVSNGHKDIKGFTKLDDREIQLIERERLLIYEAVSIIQKATPTMKDISLLVDAASRLSEPFLLVIVGEFNSGKSTVINALLGRSYLKEGVIPTTNEITQLLHSELGSGSHNRCERNADGQFICYLSSPILKVMNLVDTPGTNVILQRQQRLTEEFVPRADLILFVISADRPLTESEKYYKRLTYLFGSRTLAASILAIIPELTRLKVAFLSYIQQWRKKVVFILNKLDLYQTSSELEEATFFVKENARKLLNADNVILFPVSARAALDAKLFSSNYSIEEYQEALFNDPRWTRSRFFELENFLFNLLDGTTETGMERVKLKLETPVAIADRLLSSCQTLVKQEYENASEDLISINGIVNSVKDYAVKIESESVSWRKNVTAVIETAKARALKLVDSLLRLSNIDLIPSYALKSERASSMLATSAFQNDIINPAISNTQSLLADYIEWLESSNSHEASRYLEQFGKQWPAYAGTDSTAVHMGTYSIHNIQEGIGSKVIEDFSASAAAKLLEQEIREVVLGAFGGLGAAGLSASLLTSVLPTTLEDLLALAICSAGGWLAISSFPARRKEAMAKIGRVADKLAREINEAMEKDLMISIEKLTNFVEVISKPYAEAAQARIDRSIQIQDELAKVEQSIQALKVEIQNLHVS